MKVCIFGCKTTTLLLARHVHEFFGVSAIITIDAEKGAKADVADYCDVRKWADQRDIRVYSADRYDLKSEVDRAFFESEGFDLGFVAGWQRLVPSAVLSTFSTGVFGMHGSAANLPIGRGRSPMNWAIIEGRKSFYTNLFRYDPGVDSGDVLDTFCFSISDQDTAETLHFKNTMSMIALIRRNRDRFLSGQLELSAQADDLPTYYPKRTADDSLIDWDAPVDLLDRFIRAVAPPFNGAFSFIGSERISITRASIFELDSVLLAPPGRRGEIVEVFPNGKFLVRGVGGTLIVHEWTAADSGGVQAGAVFHHQDMRLKVFPTNRHGGHDLTE